MFFAPMALRASLASSGKASLRGRLRHPRYRLQETTILTQGARNMDLLGPIVSRYKADPTDPHSPNIVIYTRETWDETVVYLD